MFLVLKMKTLGIKAEGREREEMASEFHQFLYISEFIATFWITKVNLLKILIVIWLQLSHEGILFSSGYLNFL